MKERCPSIRKECQHWILDFSVELSFESCFVFSLDACHCRRYLRCIEFWVMFLFYDFQKKEYKLSRPTGRLPLPTIPPLYPTRGPSQVAFVWTSQRQTGTLSKSTLLPCFSRSTHQTFASYSALPQIKTVGYKLHIQKVACQCYWERSVLCCIDQVFVIWRDCCDSHSDAHRCVDQVLVIWSVSGRHLNTWHKDLIVELIMF